MKSRPSKSKKSRPVSAGIETAAPPESGVSRRRFFNVFWTALGLAALVELFWVAISFLRPTGSRTEDSKAGAVVQAGMVESFATGTVTAFQRGQFYLVRMDNGGMLALSCKCTHLGCTVPWVEKEKKFLCPCHASSFDITGNVINAPAARALDMLQVTIENNIVKVEAGKRIKRSEFEPKQVVYPPKI
jgi:cytochrome b6-f complex iron-sulfur subunit